MSKQLKLKHVECFFYRFNADCVNGEVHVARVCDYGLDPMNVMRHWPAEYIKQHPECKSVIEITKARVCIENLEVPAFCFQLDETGEVKDIAFSISHEE